jgi:DNA polymerase (family X)
MKTRRKARLGRLLSSLAARLSPRRVAMTNEKIARRFERMATLMELRGDDRFRARAYRNAAEAIGSWPAPVERMARDGGAKALQKIPGVGAGLSGKIVELVESGTFAAWEQLTAETPETVLDLLEVEGVGPKTAAALHQRFKISTLEELRLFAEGGGLDLLDNLGEKAAERIRRSVNRLTG